MKTVKKIGVIGAGVMGAGIAAQAANAGAEVILLDVVDGAAAGAVQKMLKAKPAVFMHKDFAHRITPGSSIHDLHLVKDCDWVIEAVIENPAVKQKLYADVAQHIRANAVLSSNTSTLPVEVLTQGMTDTLKSRFFITHFFNPPRYMRLLEIVFGPKTKPSAVAPIMAFADERMGKSIIQCQDTPGFIANRIGTFWLHAAFTEAMAFGIDVEQADAVLGRPIGVPKTGVFALMDLVGLDLMPHILDSFHKILPPDDAFHALGPAPAILKTMIDGGYTGRKGKGGFYRLDRSRNKEVIDLKTGLYSPAKRPKPKAATVGIKDGIRALFEHSSVESRYAWSVMSKTLAYAVQLASSIADDVESIDRAMRLGYNWKWGPFELIDKLGTTWFRHKLMASGQTAPALLQIANGRPFYETAWGQLHMLAFDGSHTPVTRPPGVLLLQDVKRSGPPLFKNSSAKVWDLGDGVACLEFCSKMNSLNPFILSLMNRAVRELPQSGFKGLVIYNEGTNFSVGANLAMLMVCSKLRLWPVVRWILKQGQDTFSHLKYAPFPVVGAPTGMAIGGGCEVLLHCDRLTPHAESYIGLVEAGVGIVPGWGGCKELLRRWTLNKDIPHGPMPPVMKAFETIATAHVSGSAFEAEDLAFVTSQDTIVMNKDRVLATAKTTVLNMAKGYTPPAPIELRLPGPSGQAALHLAIRNFANQGLATPHDVTIATELARVLSGDNTDVLDITQEHDILKLERDAILRLIKTPQTRARVVHMLKMGKPLRN